MEVRHKREKDLNSGLSSETGKEKCLWEILGRKVNMQDHRQLTGYDA